MSKPLLKILVGDADFKTETDIDVDVVWAEMLPREKVKAFDEYLFIDGDTYAFDSSVVARVYNDTPINWIGEQIEKDCIEYDAVAVVTEHGTHAFDEDGVLDDTWPHGIFNY